MVKKNELLDLLQSKEFSEFAKNIMGVIEKNYQVKTEYMKEQLTLEKERLQRQKELEEIKAKNEELQYSTGERIIKKWFLYSGILFFLSLVAIGIMSYYKLITAEIAGTILASIIGFVFGRATGLNEESN